LYIDYHPHSLPRSPYATFSTTSGKSWPDERKAAFENQVVDRKWKSLCQYTRAPQLAAIFSICGSVKSWLDLSEENIAIIACPKGQPNTGILIGSLTIALMSYSSSR
jgi:hypothetical protein